MSDSQSKPVSSREPTAPRSIVDAGKETFAALVLLVRNRLEAMQTGEVLEIEIVAGEDAEFVQVRAWCLTMNHLVIGEQHADGRLRLRIAKEGRSPPVQQRRQ